jgi:hypothetical protein
MPYEIKFSIEDEMLSTVVSVLQGHVRGINIIPLTTPLTQNGEYRPPLALHHRPRKQQTLVGLVLELMQKPPNKKLSYGEIVAKVAAKGGFNSHSVSPTLSKLVAKGKLLRHPHSMYSVTPQSDEPPGEAS